MNQEQELNHQLRNADLLVLSGSRLYGTNTPQSDYDYRGFIVPPFEYLVGLSKFDQQVIRDPDSVIYSIRRFFELLMMGDPGTLEILYAPKSNIALENEIGNILINHRSLFVTRQSIRRIVGYAQSEWRKVTGTQLVPTKRTSTEDEVIESIRQVFHPKRENMDEIIRLLFLQHKKEIRSAKRKLGAKRKQQIQKYGYCVSSACHTIRLLGQSRELVDTGKLTFPRPNAEILLSIKRGELPLEKVTEIYNSYMSRSEFAEKPTHLPDKPPIKHIRNLYHQIIAQKTQTDPQCKQYADRYWINARQKRR